MLQKWRLIVVAFILTQAGFCGATQSMLTRVLWHQTPLGSQLICLFTHMPSCVYEPELFFQQNKQKLSTIKRADFLVPFFRVSSDAQTDIDHINSTKNTEYSLDFKAGNRPVKSLRICVSYNPKKTVWQYQSCPSLLGQKALIFSFYSKKIVKTLGTRTSPLRWYKNSVHQPRILLAQEHSNKPDHEQENSIARHLANMLVREGCEVLTTENNRHPVFKTDWVNYANMVVQPDLLIAIGNSTESGSLRGPRVSTLNNKSFTCKQQSGRSSDLAKLDQFYAQLSKKSLSCAQLVHKALNGLAAPNGKDTQEIRFSCNNHLLVGAQMPAISLEMPAHPSSLKLRRTGRENSKNLKLIKNISQGVMDYLAQSGFAVRRPD